jgi:hypothetical protein
MNLNSPVVVPLRTGSPTDAQNARSTIIGLVDGTWTTVADLSSSSPNALVIGRKDFLPVEPKRSLLPLSPRRTQVRLKPLLLLVSGHRQN